MSRAISLQSAPVAERTELHAEAMRAERERILDIYSRRGTGDYAFSDLWSLQIAQRREFLLARMLGDAGVASLADQRILDVGCGDGRLLRLFSHWGASPESLHGCDINAARLEAARKLQPGVDYRQSSGNALPYADGCFDVVCQCTVFTSILSQSMRTVLAAEMRRVLRPGGRIVWFDFRYNNPRNVAVRGIGKRELLALFPGCRLRAATLGLLPPLARRLTPLSPVLAALLERIPPLRYAYLALIQPENRA
jgi:ubiquinone/menaquinone biosynthesis C-methylase UbiE